MQLFGLTYRDFWTGRQGCPFVSAGKGKKQTYIGFTKQEFIFIYKDFGDGDVGTCLVGRSPGLWIFWPFPQVKHGC